MFGNLKCIRINFGIKKRKGITKMTECSIDEFTIHCVEMEIKKLIVNNEDYQRNISQNSLVEYLIFENRKLVLYELLGKVQQLRTTHKEYLERLDEVKE